MLFRLLKDAQLTCNRCSLEVLLTPFWSPIKHLLFYYFITNWLTVDYKLAFYMCFSRPLKMFYSKFCNDFFCVVMFGLINVNILYYSFSTLYQMCNLRQSLWVYKTNHTSAAYCPGRIDDWTSNNTRWDRVGEIFDPLPYE